MNKIQNELKLKKPENKEADTEYDLQDLHIATQRDTQFFN